MDELEQAFEDVAKQDNEKLSEMLSAGRETEEETNSEVLDEGMEEENEQNESDTEACCAEGVPHSVSAEIMANTAQRDWEGQFIEISEYTGKGIYGYRGLKSLPNFPEIDRLIKGGATVLQAYKMANFDSIIKNEVQKERNKIRGKAHLMVSRGGADANEVVVPNDVYRAFKMLEPNMSDEEIRQYYKKTYNN